MMPGILPLTGQKLLCGRFGAAIAPSAAPAMLESAIRALGGYGFCQTLQHQDYDLEQQLDVLFAARHMQLAGITIGAPYQESVFRLPDSFSRLAKSIGAANLIVPLKDDWMGHNTEATGFLAALRAQIAAGIPDVAGKTLVVYGTDGLGKAVAFALAKLWTKKLVLVDPSFEKSLALLKALQPTPIEVEIAPDVASALVHADGLVNCTAPKALPCMDNPIPEGLLHEGLMVIDTVCVPLMTPLLRSAQNKGATIMNGRSFAIHEACETLFILADLAKGRGCEEQNVLRAAIVEVMGRAFDGEMARRAG